MLGCVTGAIERDPTKAGYIFVLTLAPDRATWSATAAPIETGVTGLRCFLRFDRDGAPVGAQSRQVGG